MKAKKVLLIILLILIVGGITWVIVNSSSGKKEKKIAKNEPTSQRASAVEETQKDNSINEQDNTIPVDSETEEPKKTEESSKEVTETGTVYKIKGIEITPEIVLKDNYFDTQIADINLNFSRYEGKTIQIEGMFFKNAPYTFVGRYSLSNLCPDCPSGYSYFEYEWHGDETLNLTEETDWIKVIGTLRKGNDGMEYYYIDAASIEVMNERGQDTVSN